MYRRRPLPTWPCSVRVRRRQHLPALRRPHRRRRQIQKMKRMRDRFKCVLYILVYAVCYDDKQAFVNERSFLISVYIETLARTKKVGGGINCLEQRSRLL
jgi:hypothetical protein